MMTNAAGGGWGLLFMAVLIPGFHHQRNDSSIQTGSNSKAQIYQPVLQPSESIPPIGMYTLRTRAGKPCIKASMGAEFIVIEKKTWYFNLDPSRVQTTGYCEKQAALMSLTLPDNAASLQFTFRKEKDVFYVTKITAHVSPLPVCQKCANKTYSGLVDHEKLFKTTDGRSFKCKSENLLLMSSVFNVKLVPLQIQAFTVPKGQYGKEVECWADFNRRVIPIVIGATVVGLILIAVLTFLFIKDRRRQGYESL
ncbi:lysosome-associated membrane glycoprotein 3 [Sphaeramia orbicularis]|uniref:Lysosome-associated membrane glycoprotein 2-like luminal domain-containing protein n=1 Tax=Sphaeramia orbicularis TaxID=375764 RepID=A0A673CP34_9TELE|nr:lysosome-associated membrane glycoprotein 3 [Sphaeramia orbicularis]